MQYSIPESSVAHYGWQWFSSLSYSPPPPMLYLRPEKMRVDLFRNLHDGLQGLLVCRGLRRFELQASFNLGYGHEGRNLGLVIYSGFNWKLFLTIILSNFEP